MTNYTLVEYPKEFIGDEEMRGSIIFKDSLKPDGFIEYILSSPESVFDIMYIDDKGINRIQSIGYLRK